MTIPPDDKPYESDIRANTSTGLGGLFSQLAAIAEGIASLPQLVTLLTEIRNYLQKLIGDAAVPTGYTGLPSELRTISTRVQSVNTFLNTSIGAADPADGDLSMRQLVSLVQQALYYNNDQDNPIWELLLIGNGHLNAIRGFSNEQSSVLGFIGDAPAGKSIKALLEDNRVANVRAADCCEDANGGGEEPPPPDQTQPCETEGTSFRVTSYEFWRNLPADQFDEYILVFNGIDAASSGNVITQLSTNTPPLTGLATTINMALLVESNLLTGQVPSQVARYLSGVDNDFSASTGALSTPGLGCGATTTVELDSDEGLVMFTIRIPQGAAVPTHKNYWLNFAPVPV